MVISAYVVFNNAKFPPATVIAAGVALFADILGLAGVVLKIVLNPTFVTQLNPVTRVEQIYIPVSTEAHLPPQIAQEELKITSAVWGAGDATKNVTEFLNSKIEGGRLEIWATWQALECDPAPMVVKMLKVTYTYGDKTYSKKIPETAMLSLP